MPSTYIAKNPKNRIDLDSGNYCPPHRFGEGKRLTGIFKILGEPVSDEPCHIHRSKISHISHHNPFCVMIRCPHYGEMRQSEREYRLTGKI